MSWPTLEEILPRMESVKELEPDADGSRRFTCLCPAHEDNRESLTVIESTRLNGRAIFHCHAQCTKEAVCAGFGFDPTEAKTQPTTRRTIQAERPQLHERKHLEEYEYRLADGSLNHVVVRHSVPRKEFRQYRLDPMTGENIHNMKGVTRSLFRLERLVSRSPLGTLWIVEGEHDVLNMEIMGADATSKSGGAASKWSEVLIDQIASLNPGKIGIICDNDDAGFKSGINLHELLKQRGFAKLGVFKPRPAVEKADVTTHFEAGYVLKDLMPLTNEELSLGKTKKKEIPVRVASYLDCTENGAAIYLERTIGDQVMYVPGLDEPWHYLRDGIWVADRDEVESLARNAFENRIAQAHNAGDNQLLASAMRFASRRGIENALYLMKNSVKVQVGELGELANPDLVAIRNGVIDLKTGILQNHDPTLRFTMQIKSRLDPDAKCPRWLAFLEEVQPDKQVQAWLQKFFGACLSGEMPQIVVCNIGTGLNGKSVAINTIMSVLGDYAGTADASTFMSGRSLGANEQRSDLTRLRGKRMVSSSETDAGASLNEGFIKSWCGGEEILARAMYAKTPISYEPQGKLVLTSNHKPRIKEQDLGVWRRIRLIPWSVRIKEVDDRIQEKLREEAAGILNWLIEGAVSFYECGLDKLPPVIRKATSEYQEDEDELGDFLLECCELGPEHTILSADLYSAYVRYNDKKKTKPMSQNKFGRRLTQRGFLAERSSSDPDNREKKAGSRQWAGIHLNEETRWSF